MLYQATHAIQKTQCSMPTHKILHDVFTQWFLVHSFSTFIFVTTFLHFLLMPLLNAMSAYIELFIYSTPLVKLLSVFRVPVTWKHLKAVATKTFFVCI